MNQNVCLTLSATARAGVVLAGCALLLGSCASTGAVGSTQVAAGSASYIAALGGGIVGHESNLSLSKADRQRALEAEYRALEAAPGGQPVVWQGSGVSGSVVATAPYQVGSQNCRQYSHTVSVKGQDNVARGVACRNGDGSWTPLT
ncbi:surface antigen [Pararhizobium capsulatum DSM 1112]|uniref:Surface antigen n=1 Tax=Pararhizobium capsulatum DSM 1112 TaxID=1121113 RepID=A0ABU0BMY5_9HYPH|nr:surface antigen [Pararhizobium capsulatum DSM 1112]